MKIFGIEFKTKKELKAELKAMKEAFPFTIGQTVYDIQLRNDKGRYVSENASLEHSRISEVIVDNKNYFGLVERYNNNDVFLDYLSANVYLESVCVK